MWDSSKGQRRCDVYVSCLLRRWGARGWWIGLANRMMEKRRDLEVGDYGGGGWRGRNGEDETLLLVACRMGRVGGW